MPERISHNYSIESAYLQNIKEKVLYWCSRYDTFSFLDNNLYAISPNRYELLAGAGVLKPADIAAIQDAGDWVMGQINFEYDPLHVSEEKMSDAFIPETVFIIHHGDHTTLTIESTRDPDSIFSEIMECAVPLFRICPQPDEAWQWSEDRQSYLSAIESIRKDIYRGAYYELNYCISCSTSLHEWNGPAVFLKQNMINPSPFAAYYKYGDTHILSASPERFLYKEKDRLVCQPIKGTAPREADPEKDRLAQQALYHNVKERAENVMIVDLTRNDLYRCCEPNSVDVPELFGIYTFPFVHQMISTVRGTLKKNTSFHHILSVTYPMGSMTGAPKKTVTEHIRKYEKGRRNQYSGCIFYVTPAGDFDSSVVIRTLVYNEKSKDLCFHTGGAITYDSVPEKEWEEVQLKAMSMIRIFE